MSIKPTITVLYTCVTCGAFKRAVDVEARESDEGVLEWMKKVQMVVGADHARRNCISSTCDLRIPMPKDADWVGQASKT